MIKECLLHTQDVFGLIPSLRTLLELSPLTYEHFVQYKLKRCSKKECCKQYVDMSGLMAPCQNGRYKNQHTEQHKNT